MIHEEYEWSRTELDLLAEKLTDPLVVRYFKSLGQNLAHEIMKDTIATVAQGSNEVLLRLSHLQGRYDALEQLLEIKPSPESTE